MAIKTVLAFGFVLLALGAISGTFAKDCSAVTCTADFTPVCASNPKGQKTYPNACVAGCDDAVVDYQGECKKACSSCPANIEEPICVLTSKGPRSYSNPCFATCQGIKVRFYNSYQGKCNSKCDAKCSVKGTSPSSSQSQCCSNKEMGTAAQYPNSCYATCLGNKDKCYKGTCTGDDAVLLARECATGGATAKCFRDPCSAPTTCPSDKKAVCVSRSCQSFYRGQYFGKICSAMYLDSRTWDVVKGCEAL